MMTQYVHTKDFDSEIVNEHFKINNRQYSIALIGGPEGDAFMKKMRLALKQNQGMSISPDGEIESNIVVDDEIVNNFIDLKKELCLYVCIHEDGKEKGQLVTVETVDSWPYAVKEWVNNRAMVINGFSKDGEDTVKN